MEEMPSKEAVDLTFIEVGTEEEEGAKRRPSRRVGEAAPKVAPRKRFDDDMGAKNRGPRRPVNKD